MEGLGGACSWSGGLAWIVAESPPSRRGALIGSALGAAIGGALFGPVIGTAAVGVGRAAAFSGVVVIAVVLIDQARRLPSSHVPSGQGVRRMLEAVGSGPIAVGMWLVALPALAAGALDVLGSPAPAPPRRERRGHRGRVPRRRRARGAVSPLVGSFSDRHGRMIPVRLGLAGAGALLLCFTLPQSPVVLGLLVVAIAATTGAFWAPAMAMLSDAADAQGLDQGLAAALINVAWAGGQIAGSGAGGALAKAGGDEVPMACAAVLCAVTLVGLLSSAAGRLPVGPADEAEPAGVEHPTRSGSPAAGVLSLSRHNRD